MLKITKNPDKARQDKSRQDKARQDNAAPAQAGVACFRKILLPSRNAEMKEWIS